MACFVSRNESSDRLLGEAGSGDGVTPGVGVPVGTGVEVGVGVRSRNLSSGRSGLSMESEHPTIAVRERIESARKKHTLHPKIRLPNRTSPNDDRNIPTKRSYW